MISPNSIESLQGFLELRSDVADYQGSVNTAYLRGPARIVAEWLCIWVQCLHTCNSYNSVLVTLL